MSSILTNTSSMVALQTLKSINSNLGKVQSEISTGKTVNSAKDNAALWAISKTMESDVSGFKSIQETLSVGESTVAVARQATETITDLLGEIKTRVVAATGDNVDRAKLSTEIVSLSDQIQSVVGAAQFNGLNLLNSVGTTSVLSSLDRDSTGNVSASTIDVATVNFSDGAYSGKDVFGTATAGLSAAGEGFAATTAAAATADIEIADDTLAAGDQINLTFGDEKVTYVITAADVAATSTAETIAINLKAAIEGQVTSNISVDYDTSAADTITITNNESVSMNITGQFQNAGAGAMSALGAGLDISSSANAQASLGTVEGLIDTAINASSAFGTVENRISIQKDFVSTLTDAVKSGIGSLVDADMEEASARLQALQVQQQLGVQSLSIANQAPQALLSLFR